MHVCTARYVCFLQTGRPVVFQLCKADREGRMKCARGASSRLGAGQACPYFRFVGRLFLLIVVVGMSCSAPAWLLRPTAPAAHDR
jgi:hypothetical protein